MDRYTQLLKSAEGIPNSLRQRSTIIGTPVFAPEARETYVIETLGTPEGSYIFLDIMDGDGQGQRVALPPKVSQAIYAHRDRIVAKRVSSRAKAAAATRKERGIVPFEKKGATP